MTEEQISVEFPEAGRYDLRFSVGPGVLRISPKPGGKWVEGTFTDPTGHFPLKISQNGGELRVGNDRQFSGNWRGVRSGPEFNLTLGDAHPYSVQIEGGANDFDCDFGGLPLVSLKSQSGAGRIRYTFSAPNPQPLDLLKIEGGAADIELSNLANANAATIDVDGGVASFRLDFGGTLQRDLSVDVRTGVATVELSIPKETPVKLKKQSALGMADIGDGFITREGGFWNQAAIDGTGPVISIAANSSLGTLRVRLT